jgi:hypothetical protein
MKPLAMPATGRADEIADIAPLIVSAKPSLTPRMINAGKQVHRLFKMVSLPDVGDPEVFLSAATLLFADYAPQLGDRAVPMLATKSDRPTLKLMKEVLDELNHNALEQQQRKDDRLRALPHLTPRAPRTKEEQERVDKQVAECRRAFGIPDRNSTSKTR